MSVSSKTKRARRTKRLARRSMRAREHARQQSWRSRFPEPVYRAGNAPESLVRIVRKVFESLAASYHRFEPQHAAVLSWCKHHGFGRLDEDSLWVLFARLGERLFEVLPDEVFERYFPYHFVQPVPCDGGKILLLFSSLERVKTPGGTAYHSPQRPKLQGYSAGPVVAFYRHAVERILERTIGDARSYLGLGDAFAYLNDCVYFEPWSHDGQSGFTLFERCPPRTFFSWQYATAILGAGVSPERPWYYRVGYCPAVRRGELLVGTTLLVPGMEGTPEHGWYLRNVGSTKQARDALYERAKGLTKAELFESQDFSLLKQFHDGGIPQVVEIKETVYRYRR